MNESEMARPGGASPAPHPVAEVMVRVQSQLRSGVVPSFEALLAYGEPGRG